MRRTSGINVSKKSGASELPLEQESWGKFEECAAHIAAQEHERRETVKTLHRLEQKLLRHKPLTAETSQALNEEWEAILTLIDQAHEIVVMSEVDQRLCHELATKKYGSKTSSIITEFSEGLTPTAKIDFCDQLLAQLESELAVQEGLWRDTLHCVGEHIQRAGLLATGEISRGKQDKLVEKLLHTSPRDGLSFVVQASEEVGEEIKSAVTELRRFIDLQNATEADAERLSIQREIEVARKAVEAEQAKVLSVVKESAFYTLLVAVQRAGAGAGPLTQEVAELLNAEAYTAIEPMLVLAERNECMACWGEEKPLPTREIFIGNRSLKTRDLFSAIALEPSIALTAKDIAAFLVQVKEQRRPVIEQQLMEFFGPSRIEHIPSWDVVRPSSLQIVSATGNKDVHLKLFVVEKAINKPSLLTGGSDACALWCTQMDTLLELKETVYTGNGYFGRAQAALGTQTFDRDFRRFASSVDSSDRELLDLRRMIRRHIAPIAEAIGIDYAKSVCVINYFLAGKNYSSEMIRHCSESSSGQYPRREMEEALVKAGLCTWDGKRLLFLTQPQEDALYKNVEFWQTVQALADHNAKISAAASKPSDISDEEVVRCFRLLATRPVDIVKRILEIREPLLNFSECAREDVISPSKGKTPLKKRMDRAYVTIMVSKFGNGKRKHYEQEALKLTPVQQYDNVRHLIETDYTSQLKGFALDYSKYSEQEVVKAMGAKGLEALQTLKAIRSFYNDLRLMDRRAVRKIREVKDDKGENVRESYFASPKPEVVIEQLDKVLAFLRILGDKESVEWENVAAALEFVKEKKAP